MAQAVFVDLRKAESDDSYGEAVRRVIANADADMGGHYLVQADGSPAIPDAEFRRRVFAAVTQSLPGQRTFSDSDVARLAKTAPEVPIFKGSLNTATDPEYAKFLRDYDKAHGQLNPDEDDGKPSAPLTQRIAPRKKVRDGFGMAIDPINRDGHGPSRQAHGPSTAEELRQYNETHAGGKSFTPSYKAERVKKYQYGSLAEAERALQKMEPEGNPLASQIAQPLTGTAREEYRRSRRDGYGHSEEKPRSIRPADALTKAEDVEVTKFSYNVSLQPPLQGEALWQRRRRSRSGLDPDTGLPLGKTGKRGVD